MIRPERTRVLRAEYAPKFSSDDAFQVAWDRAWDKLHRPDEAGLRRWLDADLEADEARAAGSIRTPILPVQQDHDELEKHVELPSGHDFADPTRCPRCLLRQREGRPGFSIEMLPGARSVDPIGLLAGRISARRTDER